MYTARIIDRPRFAFKTQLLAAITAIVAAIVLPQICHLIGHFTGTGSALGNILLPMHFPILLVGLWIGPVAGGVAGLLCPLISYALTGMPNASLLPFMVLELAIYGLCAGCLRNAPMPEFFKVVLSQLTGRLLRAMVILSAFYGFGYTAVAPSIIWTSIYTGIIGIVLQWIFIPMFVKGLEKR